MQPDMTCLYLPRTGPNSQHPRVSRETVWMADVRLPEPSPGSVRRKGVGALSSGSRRHRYPGQRTGLCSSLHKEAEVETRYGEKEGGPG